MISTIATVIGYIAMGLVCLYIAYLIILIILIKVCFTIGLTIAFNKCGALDNEKCKSKFHAIMYSIWWCLKHEFPDPETTIHYKGKRIFTWNAFYSFKVL